MFGPLGVWDYMEPKLKSLSSPFFLGGGGGGGGAGGARSNTLLTLALKVCCFSFPSSRIIYLIFY